MNDETPNRPAGTPDGGGRGEGGGGECSPLQTRAAFLKNWDWQSVVSINQRACARAGAQHGVNSQAGKPGEPEWETTRISELTLLETIEFLRACHRGAPFLFFNGNTFSFLGRELMLALFSDLPVARKRELASSVAHCIAGVLDLESMSAAVESLWQTAQIGVGDKVRTLRGSLHGVVVRVLDDGRVVWRAEESGSELVSLPEALCVEG